MPPADKPSSVQPSELLDTGNTVFFEDHPLRPTTGSAAARTSMIEGSGNQGQFVTTADGRQISLNQYLLNLQSINKRDNSRDTYHNQLENAILVCVFDGKPEKAIQLANQEESITWHTRKLDTEAAQKLLDIQNASIAEIQKEGSPTELFPLAEKGMAYNQSPVGMDVAAQAAASKDKQPTAGTDGAMTQAAGRGFAINQSPARMNTTPDQVLTRMKVFSADGRTIPLTDYVANLKKINEQFTSAHYYEEVATNSMMLERAIQSCMSSGNYQKALNLANNNETLKMARRDNSPLAADLTGDLQHQVLEILHPSSSGEIELRSPGISIAAAASGSVVGPAPLVHFNAGGDQSQSPSMRLETPSPERIGGAWADQFVTSPDPAYVESIFTQQTKLSKLFDQHIEITTSAHPLDWFDLNSLHGYNKLSTRQRLEIQDALLKRHEELGTQSGRDALALWEEKALKFNKAMENIHKEGGVEELLKIVKEK
jgi:hypothetical protein